MSHSFEIDSEMLPEVPALTPAVDVYYYDTDAGGVVHNVAYLRMIETARSLLAEYLGWPLKAMHETGLVPVVVRTEIDYVKPATLGDNLLIHSRLSELGKVRFVLEFTIIRAFEADDEEAEVIEGDIIAQCRQVMATVQLPEGKPRRVPAAWAAAYPDLVASRAAHNE